MADTPQTFANHTKWYPLFHFFASPVLTINALAHTYYLTRSPSKDQLWATVVAWAIAAGVFSARVMSLRAQDRVIRLEERLRMQRLLPADLQDAIDTISPRYIVALRFASEAELPGLVRRTLAGEFTKPVEIKKAVREWRPDYHRA